MGAAAARRYAPDPASARSVRAFVADQVRDLGLDTRADEAAMLVSELVTNVILHAGTDFEVRVEAIPDGVRVEVEDGSPTLPTVGTLTVTALSGRGLMLVQAMSTRCGASRGPGSGKTVWFELSSQESEGPQVDDIDLLLDMWEDSDDARTGPTAELVEVVVPDVPVQRLVEAKAHMEDLLRELQLIEMTADSEVGTPTERRAVLSLAKRLDEAAQEFAEGRRQVRAQALAASARGDEVVTLRVCLPSDAAAAARRYQEAVEAAVRLPEPDLLGDSAVSMRDHADIRRRYLGAIVDELGARAGSDGIVPADRPIGG